jgi:polyhydroxyalkanoate synthesis regulator phasin
MIEVVKKTLLAGIGAAVITKDAVDHALRDWVEKGKISPDEARHFSDRLVSAGNSRWEDTRDCLAGRVEELMASANVATRARIEALEARVGSLETRLAAAERDSTVGGA